MKEIYASTVEAEGGIEPPQLVWTPARQQQAREHWFAAGRLAGLREAAEVARSFSNVRPGDICEVQAAEWQYGIAAAILALAEGEP
jgi:hypothetical protein